LKCPLIDVCIYDIDSTRRKPLTTTLHDILLCDIIFICVPTPSLSDGSCNISIVESVITELRNLKHNLNNIIVRSTVPPLTCQRLNVSFMPEFLTEKNWIDDFKRRNTWIIGLDSKNSDLRLKIEQLISYAYQYKCIENNKICFVSTVEAEIIKYTINCFLSTKVSFFNEIQEYCSKLSIDYETVRNLVIEDDRIGSSHTRVPGYDKLYGFSGSCLPKDLSAFIKTFEQNDLNPYLLKAVMMRNSHDLNRNKKNDL